MPRYFAYGSNMSSARLEARVGPVEVVGRGRLEAFRHRFSKHGRDGSAKGNIERAPGSEVWGVVYELDVHQHETLIGFETGYRQTLLEVRNDHGDLIRVTSFEAYRIASGLLPTPEYLSHYLTGIREHELPRPYHTEIFRGLEHLIAAIDAHR